MLTSYIHSNLRLERPSLLSTVGSGPSACVDLWANEGILAPADSILSKRSRGWYRLMQQIEFGQLDLGMYSRQFSRHAG